MIEGGAFGDRSIVLDGTAPSALAYGESTNVLASGGVGFGFGWFCVYGARALSSVASQLTPNYANIPMKGPVKPFPMFGTPSYIPGQAGGVANTLIGNSPYFVPLDSGALKGKE